MSSMIDREIYLLDWMPIRACILRFKFTFDNNGENGTRYTSPNLLSLQPAKVFGMMHSS